MAKKWYCKSGKKELGPLNSQQLKELVEKGKLTRDHLIRPDSSKDWVKASEVAGLFATEKKKKKGKEEEKKEPAASEKKKSRSKKSSATKPEPPVLPPPKQDGSGANLGKPPVQSPSKNGSGLNLTQPPPRQSHSSFKMSSVSDKKDYSVIIWAGSAVVTLVALAFILAILLGGGAERPPTNPKNPTVAKKSDEEKKNVKKATPETFAALSKKALLGEKKIQVNGNLTLLVDKGYVAPPRLLANYEKMATPSARSKPQLVLEVTISNTGKKKVIKYRGWGSLNIFYLDENDNKLGRSKLVSSRPALVCEGQLKEEKIYPGEEITDLLYLERPVPAAKTLVLALPGGALEGVKQPLYLKLDPSSFEKRETPVGVSAVAPPVAPPATSPAPVAGPTEVAPRPAPGPVEVVMPEKESPGLVARNPTVAREGTATAPAILPAVNVEGEEDWGNIPAATPTPAPHAALRGVGPQPTPPPATPNRAPLPTLTPPPAQGTLPIFAQ